MDFRRLWPWLSLVLAVVVLNAGLTFHNVWPTLGIRWPGELSVEVAALFVVLALTHSLFGPTPRALLAALSVLFVVFALGRYGDVTAPALYGREVNLYWDVPNMTSVVAMLAKVATFWQIAGVVLGLVLSLTILYLVARWSLRRVDAAMSVPRLRLVFGIAGAALLACFGVQQLSDAVPRIPRFSIPVSKVYGTQIAKVMDTFSDSRALRSLPASPRLQSQLAALNRDDVLLVFEESYGSTTYDRPEFRQFLKPVRERLDAAVRDTGREVVSTFVSSPTFGGNSWFAHISMLTGVEVRDPDRYALLMTQKRPSLASMFQGAGYRTIAVMPGLHENWPEGRFYGFNQLYDVNRLDYHGPEFGWWRIPDQYSLAELSLREIQPEPRKPVFVFFPTVSTHMPFRPTPPVQEDWQRVLTSTPYDPAPLKKALAETPEWTNMGRSYIGAVGYFFDTISTYLRARRDDNFVLIILGDHQPAANVSGEGASWDIPVHVITRNRAVLDALKRNGFESGLYPTRAPIGRMNDLTPLLVGAFEGAPGERRSVPAR